jgi:hypothetical protein
VGVEAWSGTEDPFHHLEEGSHAGIRMAMVLSWGARNEWTWEEEISYFSLASMDKDQMGMVHTCLPKRSSRWIR